MSFVIFSVVGFFILVLDHKWKIEKSRICWRINFLDQGWNDSGPTSGQNKRMAKFWAIFFAKFLANFWIGHSILNGNSFYLAIRWSGPVGTNHFVGITARDLRVHTIHDTDGSEIEFEPDSNLWYDVYPENEYRPKLWRLQPPEFRYISPLGHVNLYIHVSIYLYKPSKVVCSTICLIFDLHN